MSLTNIKYEKNHYLAFELNSTSRAKLLSIFIPKFSNVICHHVTIEFNLTQEKLDNIKKDFSSNPKVQVYGYAISDGIECVAVAIDSKTDRLDGSFYHITLSIEPPRKPVESNNLKDKVVLIRDMFRSHKLETIKLSGEFKLLRK